MLVSIVLVTVACIIITGYLYYVTRRPKRFPPGPYAWPIVGNLFNITWSKHLHTKADSYYRRYGAIVGLQMGSYPTVIISDAKLQRELLTEKCDIFSERPTWLTFFKLCNRDQFSMTLSNGESWKYMKRLVLQAFGKLGYTSKNFEKFIHREVGYVKNELEESKGSEFSLKNLFNKATANVSCSLLFSERQSYDDVEFETLLQGMNEAIRLFGSGVGNLAQYLPAPLCVPYILLHPGRLGRIYRFIQHLQSWMQQKVDQHGSSLDADHERDLVDVLLKADIDSQFMMNVLRDLLIGGCESVSVFLLWLVVFLVKHEDVQRRCRQEVLRVVGAERLTCWADRTQLPYTWATILETLRMCPIFPLSPALLNCSKEVQVGKFILPKHTLVVVNTFSAHYDRKYWTDPEEFRPERFLSGDGATIVKPGAFMPFGVGPRSCLADKLSQMESFIILTALLQKFKFSVRDKEALPSVASSILGASLAPVDFKVCVEHASH